MPKDIPQVGPLSWGSISTQRHAHCRRNRRLRDATFTQQHHLNALALRCRYFPPQRSFQPPHLGFAAFDHLFPPNQMASANHTSRIMKTAGRSGKPSPIQTVIEVVLAFVGLRRE
jgi:hypothetical protein